MALAAAGRAAIVEMAPDVFVSADRGNTYVHGKIKPLAQEKFQAILPK
jgi:hypothetical protein